LVEAYQGVVALSSTEESEEHETAPPEDTPTPKPELDPVEPNLEETPFKMSGTAEPMAKRFPFMPPTPRTGKIVQVGTDTSVPVLGNVPKPDFSGLLEDGGPSKSWQPKGSAARVDPEDQTWVGSHILLAALAPSPRPARAPTPRCPNKVYSSSKLFVAI
jgi:hypothetical protein